MSEDSISNVIEWLQPFKNVKEMIDDIRSKKYLSAFKNYMQSIPGMVALKPIIRGAISLGVESAVKSGVSAKLASNIGLSIGNIATKGITAYTTPGLSLIKLGAKGTETLAKSSVKAAVTNPGALATAGLYVASAFAAAHQYKQIKAYKDYVDNTSKNTGLSKIKVAFMQLKRTLSS